MVYRRDLSRDSECNSLNPIYIGWLSLVNPFFRRGRVSAEALSALKSLAEVGFCQSRGYHACPFCFPRRLESIRTSGAGEIVLGSAEIHVSAIHGEGTFVAPDLIIHYIERHSYLPPKSFLESLIAHHSN
ncbi:DUF7919 family protein [Streptomyces hydrogenans]|uniref:DUF7919 family protein n=1 Tax=Streptomyces hydrogenans TaxID=1873719 RepID=UPI0040644FA2